MRSVRVAAVQATPVILDAEACVAKAIRLLEEASAQGAETALGTIGGLICWENRMPLARWTVYQGTPQIWVAPTADDSDGWIASMRHIAIESGAYVVSAPQYIPRSAFPADFPVELPERDTLGRGGACIVEP